MKIHQFREESVMKAPKTYDGGRSYLSSGATAIFEIIALRKWKEVIDFVRAIPEAAHSKNDASSAFVGDLPLHEVCRSRPPVHVVEFLLGSYEEAVRTPGRDGLLPLHIACASGASAEVVERLIKAYPSAAQCKDDLEESLPLHLAVRCVASREVLMEVLAVYPEGSSTKDVDGKTPLDHAYNLPDGPAKQYCITSLESAPILCAAAKYASRRCEMESAIRAKGVQEAHQEFIRQLEERHEDERTEFLRVEVGFHNTLAAEKEHNCELAEIIVRLQGKEVALKRERDALREQLVEEREQFESQLHRQRIDIKTALESGREMAMESDGSVCAESGASATPEQSDPLLIQVSNLTAEHYEMKSSLKKTKEALNFNTGMVKSLNKKLANKDEDLDTLKLQLKRSKAEQKELLGEHNRVRAELESTQLELHSSQDEMKRLKNRFEIQVHQLQTTNRQLELQQEKMGSIKNLVDSLSYNVDAWKINNDHELPPPAPSVTGKMLDDDWGEQKTMSPPRNDMSETPVPRQIQAAINIRHSRPLISKQELLYGEAENEDAALDNQVLTIRTSWDKSAGETNDTALSTRTPDYEYQDTEDMSTLSHLSGPPQGMFHIDPVN